MLDFIFERKKTTIAVVILLFLPILGYLLWVSPSLLGGTAEIEIYPLEIPSGQVTEFTVTTSEQSGVVRLSNNTLPVFDNMVSTQENLSFEGNRFSFNVIAPPSVSEINITVDVGQYTKTFKIEVTTGAGPFVSGEKVYERMEYVTDRSNGMSHRVTSHPQLEVGARYYKGVFESFGYEAEVIRYWQPSGDSPIEKAIGIFIWNTVAYKWGENTKEWIVLGGHYDMVPRAIEGAYDNTAGSNCVVEIARGLSEIKTNKTIVFGLWAGEEEGLWGAQEFVDSIPDDVTVKTYLNFDMAGINYPAPYALRAIVAPDEDPDVIEQEALINLTNKSAHQILNLPKVEGVSVVEESHRGSDHYRFEQIGVPVVFFYGMSASDYEAYHTPDDTLEEMERVAGGKDNLIAGFGTVVWTGFYLTLLLDNDDTIHQMK
jgi:hypothetical protein